MDDDTTTSQHVTVWITADPQDVYALAADPAQLHRWAAGLAGSTMRRTDDGWFAQSPMGEVKVEFVAANEFGVLDHLVTLPSGEAVYNPMRVIPGGPGQPRCEVVFTVRSRPGMTQEEFATDVAAVAADLDSLRKLMED